MAEQRPAPKSHRRRWLILGLAGVLLTVGLFGAFFWMTIMAKAEGIAIGYMQAAGNALQVGRPIPDNIFETGGFRVQAMSSKQGDGQMRMTVRVRERWLNTTLYETEREMFSPGIAK